MRYTKPSILNAKKASSIIMMGDKQPIGSDNRTGSNQSTVNAYRSDE